MTARTYLPWKVARNVKKIIFSYNDGILAVRLKSTKMGRRNNIIVFILLVHCDPIKLE